MASIHQCIYCIHCLSMSTTGWFTFQSDLSWLDAQTTSSCSLWHKAAAFLQLFPSRFLCSSPCPWTKMPCEGGSYQSPLSAISSFWPLLRAHDQKLDYCKLTLKSPVLSSEPQSATMLASLQMPKRLVNVMLHLTLTCEQALEILQLGQQLTLSPKRAIHCVLSTMALDMEELTLILTSSYCKWHWRSQGEEACSTTPSVLYFFFFFKIPLMKRRCFLQMSPQIYIGSTPMLRLEILSMIITESVTKNNVLLEPNAPWECSGCTRSGWTHEGRIPSSPSLAPKSSSARAPLFYFNIMKCDDLQTNVTLQYQCNTYSGQFGSYIVLFNFVLTSKKVV